MASSPTIRKHPMGIKVMSEVCLNLTFQAKQQNYLPDQSSREYQERNADNQGQSSLLRPGGAGHQACARHL